MIPASSSVSANTPAPGAVEAVGWDEEMAEMCGEESRIYKVNENTCSYETYKSDHDIPFDACSYERSWSRRSPRS